MKKLKITEATVTAQIKLAAGMIGLGPAWKGLLFKHWSGMGSRPGVSDLIGTLPPYGRAVFIEIKRPGKEATPAQVEFLALMKRAGAVTGVVHSVEEFRDVLLNAGYSPASKLMTWKSQGLLFD